MVRGLFPTAARFQNMMGNRIARDLGPSGDVLVGLSGRGDKDMHTVQEYDKQHAQPKH